jgi:hypothetical protein
MSTSVFREIGMSYTCIRIHDGVKFVQFISMANLKLEKMEARAFYQKWEEYKEYPVRRAAELYLGAGEYREIGGKEREHLVAIVADPATTYQLAPTTVKEVNIMATAKKAPAKKAAGKKEVNGINTVVTGAKPPAKVAAAPAKQPAAKKAEKSESVGRKSNIDPTTKLTVLVKENPKRPGGASYDRFQAAYLDSKPKTVQDALDAGASSGDIAHDAAKEFIKLG